MLHIRNITIALTAAIMMATPCFAASEVTVSIGNETFIESEPYLIDSTTYVPLERFTEAVLGYDVDTTSGDYWAEVDSRAIFCEKGTLDINGEAFVPVRAISGLLGAEVFWDGEANSVKIAPSGDVLEHGDDFYSASELDLLSRLIYAESGAEELVGQCAVGDVIMNRVASEDFPNTISGVIWDSKFGVQFTPTINGMINRVPSELSVIAAKLTLEGTNVSDEILYFVEEKYATSTWIQSNREFVTEIGCHKFYS